MKTDKIQRYQDLPLIAKDDRDVLFCFTSPLEGKSPNSEVYFN